MCYKKASYQLKNCEVFKKTSELCIPKEAMVVAILYAAHPN